MNTTIDAENGVVRWGDARWPFSVDCRDGSLTLGLPEGNVRLRALSWLEKRNLARFADLGERFIREQMIRLSLPDGAEPPADDTQREVLWQLSLWLNGPDGDPGLPLDHRILSRVTFDLCRALHLPPSAFDGLGAGEVEALWRMNREAAPRAVETDDGETRILVVPDPAPGKNGSAESADSATSHRSAAFASSRAEEPPSSTGGRNQYLRRQRENPPPLAESSGRNPDRKSPAPVSGSGKTSPLPTRGGHQQPETRVDHPADAQNREGTDRIPRERFRVMMGTMPPGKTADSEAPRPERPAEEDGTTRHAASAGVPSEDRENREGARRPPDSPGESPFGGSDPPFPAERAPAPRRFVGAAPKTAFTALKRTGRPGHPASERAESQSRRVEASTEILPVSPGSPSPAPFREETFGFISSAPPGADLHAVSPGALPGGLLGGLIDECIETLARRLEETTRLTGIDLES